MYRFVNVAVLLEIFSRANERFTVAEEKHIRMRRDRFTESLVARESYDLESVKRKPRRTFFGYSIVYNSKKTSALVSGSLFVIKRAQPYRSEGNESKPKRSGLFR